MAKNITSRSKDYNQWYLDVIQTAKLADHSPVKGCMVIRPTGYAIWEKLQSILDRMLKEKGHQNAYFPLLIPESFIKKEAEHIEGFSPELAVVTHAGGKPLEEPLVVRPTSETVIGHMYSQWIQSYRDLPVLINQWCNIVRWEMRTRLFLRTSEFLWQEGHTAHETAEQAEEETRDILDTYRYFFEHYLAMPVVAGLKTETEKFPGALRTYSVEGIMQDGKALQAGTSHNLGQNFAKAFNIQFLTRDNTQQLVHTTSWGVSTRMIGGIIMTHSDDDGLVLPPKIAPVKAVIIPIWKNDGEQSKVLAYANQLREQLGAVMDPLCVQLDTQADKRPADRFFHWIQQGVPLRLEVGLREVENQNVVLVRRDNREKIITEAANTAAMVTETLESMQAAMYQKAVALRADYSSEVDTYEDFKTVMAEKGGAIYAHWDGSAETEQKIKAETKATIRCIPLNVPDKKGLKGGACMVTGKPSAQRVLFAQAY